MNTLVLLTNDTTTISQFDQLLSEQTQHVIAKKIKRAHIVEGELLIQLATLMQQSYLIDENAYNVELIEQFKEMRQAVNELNTFAAQLTRENLALQSKLQKQDEDMDQPCFDSDGDPEIDVIPESRKVETAILWPIRLSFWKKDDEKSKPIDEQFAHLENTQNAVKVFANQLSHLLNEVTNKRRPLQALDEKSTSALYQILQDYITAVDKPWLNFLDLLRNLDDASVLKLEAKKEAWLKTHTTIITICDKYQAKKMKLSTAQSQLKWQKIATNCNALIDTFYSEDGREITLADLEKHLVVVQDFCKDGVESEEATDLLERINLAQNQLLVMNKERHDLVIEMFGSDLELDLQSLDATKKGQGLLVDYLNERNSTYAYRDWFSMCVALFLGCLGYATERAMREYYLEDLRELTKAYDELPTLENYEALLDHLDEGITRPGYLQATFFSPRANFGYPAYKNSMQCHLIEFKEKLEGLELDRIAEAEATSLHSVSVASNEAPFTA